MRSGPISVFCVGCFVLVGLFASALALTEVRPVYGESGSLRVFAKNPHIKNPDFIVVGERIEIDGEISAAQDVAEMPEASNSKTDPASAPNPRPSDAIPASGSRGTPLFKRGDSVALRRDSAPSRFMDQGLASGPAKCKFPKLFQHIRVNDSTHYSRYNKVLWDVVAQGQFSLNRIDSSRSGEPAEIPKVLGVFTDFRGGKTRHAS